MPVSRPVLLLIESQDGTVYVAPANVKDSRP